MNDCNNAASNESMFLSQLYGQITGTGGRIKDFNCDANGYFSAEYTPENSSKIKLGVQGASYIIEEIPSSQDIDLGSVYITRESSIVFKVKILSDISSVSDTFFCGIYSQIHIPLKMPHPLHDTIFPIVNLVSFDIPKYPNNLNSYLEYGWYLKNGNVYSNVHTYNKFITNCNAIPDTIIINVN